MGKVQQIRRKQCTNWLEVKAQRKKKVCSKRFLKLKIMHGNSQDVSSIPKRIVVKKGGERNKSLCWF